MASSTKSILRFKSSGPMSTKTGLHPLRTKAFAVETKEIGELITSFFFVFFIEAKAKGNPAEQLLRATAYFEPTILQTFLSNCSIIEALEEVEKITKIKIKKNVIKKNRVGDHIWYVTNMKKFKRDYPLWKQKYSTKKILHELIHQFS